eukprot:2047056-Rhodomonas_salina.1
MIHNCTETAEGVARASAPQHQPNGNLPSQKYVPPAGTTGPRVGFRHAAVDHTPIMTGAQLAAAVFGTDARGANKVPTSGEAEAEPALLPSGPTESPPRVRAPGPILPLRRTVWDHAIRSLQRLISMTSSSFDVSRITLSTVVTLLVLISVLWTGYSAAVRVSTAASSFCTTLTSVLAVGVSYKAEGVPRITAAE